MPAKAGIERKRRRPVSEFLAFAGMAFADRHPFFGAISTSFISATAVASIGT